MDSMQDQIWGYFSETMVPSITKYQVQCIQSQQQLTKEDIEDLLIQGVDGVETCKVSVLSTQLAMLQKVVHSYMYMYFQITENIILNVCTHC